MQEICCKLGTDTIFGLPFLNQRGVIDTFKKQEAKEEIARGVDAVFDEKTKLLTDIHSRMVD